MQAIKIYKRSEPTGSQNLQITQDLTEQIPLVYYRFMQAVHYRFIQYESTR